LTDGFEKLRRGHDQEQSLTPMPRRRGQTEQAASAETKR
jgi:hypothetical protein